MTAMPPRQVPPAQPSPLPGEPGIARGLPSLGSLIAVLENARPIGGSEDPVVHGIVHDSRAVTPGCLFVALRGERA
ncbi:MAG: UDP-N-acetylmuramoyl-L-alanyl-D-glutamate--2,6-diaminopimelate ligase, partial [Candidatus Eremiobacteraeota bacterium]|nr:UDP-N-acetylmuramoyl-L-alanyl-D-glutamate--2,6-diaminopimelate ligase [Candidatus Eremiobacteraeota bacterium]